MATETMTLPVAPTTLYYYLEPKDGGTTQTYPGTAAEKRRKHVPHSVDIKNMRSVRDQFTLDRNGFEMIDHHSQVTDWVNDAEIKEVYYPEVIDIMKKKTGASHVVVVSHLTRRSTTAEARGDAAAKADTEPVSLNNPARFVHVDQSYRGAEQLLYLNLPEEEADKRLKSRWAIINIWQPFGKPVHRDPLGICDFKSLDEHDFRPVTANLPPPGSGHYANVSKNGVKDVRDGSGPEVVESARYEVTNVAHNPGQDWYYCEGMKPEEAWIFKIYDSKKDGRARCAAHTSFPYQDQPDEGDARTSVELRTFCFWDDESPE